MKPANGVGLSYQPAMLHRLAVQYDNPMPESAISPSQPLATEAESEENHGVWDPMPELTISITSPYVHSRVDTFTMGNLILD
jgi:hypothetical protein